MMDSIKEKTPAERYKAIADAIRDKNGTTELMKPSDMPKAIRGIIGGASLNIAYGEAPPQDTSKLWIKANEPENVSVGSGVEGVESIKYTDVSFVGYENPVSCAKVGDNIYIFDDDGKMHKFNIKTKEFTELSGTNTYYRGIGIAVVGTKIYLFGGQYLNSSYRWVQSKYIKVLDTETDTATTLSTNLIQTSANIGCVAVGKKIFLFGGNTASYFDYICEFDTETEAIIKLPSVLPFPNSGMSSALVGNKIYLFGGETSSNPAYTDKIVVFDIETKSATTIDAKIPQACRGISCGVIGTKVYLLGGGYLSGSWYRLNTINVFDTETEAITTLDTTLLTADYNMGTVTIGNKIYLFGGDSDRNSIKVFTLTHELAQGDVEIQSGFLNNKFNLINTDNARVEIGVENVFVGNENNEAEVVEAYLHNGIDWAVI